MVVYASVVEEAPAFEVGDDIFVGFFDELASEGEVPGYKALKVHRLDEGQSVLPARAQVLVTEGGGDVDDASAVVHRDKICGDDSRGVI